MRSIERNYPSATTNKILLKKTHLLLPVQTVTLIRKMTKRRMRKRILTRKTIRKRIKRMMIRRMISLMIKKMIRILIQKMTKRTMRLLKLLRTKLILKKEVNVPLRNLPLIQALKLIKIVN